MPSQTAAAQTSAMPSSGLSGSAPQSTAIRNPAQQSTAVHAPASALPTAVVSPSKINLRAGTSRKFFAQASDGSISKFVWRVNGVKGGSAATGTIDADGTFIAPELPPANNVVEIEATSASRPNISGKAVITILNPTPVIASLNPRTLNYGEHEITIEGSGFVSGSQVKMNNVALPTRFISSKRLTTTATLAPATGGRIAFTVFNPDPGNETSGPAVATSGPANPKISYLAAGRFLEQASWGPSAESIAHLQDVGFEAWLAEQFATPATIYKSSNNTADNLTDEQSEFFVHAVEGKASCIRLSADFCSVRFEDRAAAPDGSLPEHASAGCFRDLCQCFARRHLEPYHGRLS